MILRTVSFLLAVSASAILTAQEADPDLPQPLDPRVAAPLIEKPPFTRALDLSEKLQLTGIAYVEGKPVATLMDRDTKQNYLVSEQPNALGWKLAEANASTEPRLTSVILSVGAERVTIRYGDAQLTPTSSGRAGPSRWPTNEEVMRPDENGKIYVRASPYLSDADRDRYYKSWSREAHDKFRDVVRNNRDMMFKASPQERANFAKKAFDQIDAEERARGAQRR
jgi:hypothetical protein